MEKYWSRFADDSGMSLPDITGKQTCICRKGIHAVNTDMKTAQRPDDPGALP